MSEPDRTPPREAIRSPGSENVVWMAVICQIPSATPILLDSIREGSPRPHPVLFGAEMPKSKSHKGLLKRIKITKSGKIRFRRPHSRHIKSNKTGQQVRSYRRPRYARAGDMKRYSMLLFRPLRSQEQSIADQKEREASTSNAS
ncbi:MAG: hypothetical protein CMJ34_03770 [Phycisphaerae bacterium]|nr:hypothetical protein [Phycisphaerae bacterium]